MKLDKIIKKLDIVKISGNIDIEIEDIHYDSRKVTKNSLFICIKGFNGDGHNYIKEALKNGAIAFLIDRDVDLDIYENTTVIKVKNTKVDMAKVGKNFYNNPTSNIELIGITGTNGKTSVSTLLKEVLDKTSKCGLIGTIQIDDGKKIITSKNTTPESLDLQKHFNDMILNKCKYCSMEVSSHALSLDRVNESEFSIGVFTNLTKEHLDFHKNMTDYRNSKQKLFSKTHKANLINIDDSNGKIIIENIKKLKTPLYTYSINGNSDFVATNIVLEKNFVSYDLKTPTYKEHIKVNIPGKFSVYNSLAVIGICYILGININIVKNVLNETKGIKGRFESVENDKNINIIIDYAHTPDALENILKTSKEFTKGKVITVFGCGGNRDKTKRSIMGKISQENSDLTIITSDNPRFENPKEIIEDILEGIDRKNKNYLIIEDRKEAIYKSICLANKNDLVVIAGKGHEDYQIIEDKKYPFDDKKIAIEALKLK